MGDPSDLLAASSLPLPVVLLIGCLALLLAAWGTPIARAAALRFGIVDRPDGVLKTHQEPVPYLGGLAVFGAVLVSLLLVFDLQSPLLGLLLAGELVLLLGLFDDLGALTPGVKFAGQGLAVWVLVKADIQTHLAYLPPWANLLVTAFWLVAVMNAVNLLDIMDGLASSVACAASAVLVVVALLNEMPLVAATSAALCGATAGFLIYNRPPARIYLGDAGSLFIGLMLGGLTLVVRYAEDNPLAVLNPLLILSVPLFDTAFVSFVRIYRGASPFRGSPDHFALRLRRAGWSVPQILRVSLGCTLGTGVLSLLNLSLTTVESLSLYAVLAALALGVALVLGRLRV